MIEIVAVGGMPEIRPGDEIAALVCERADLRHHDVVVVTQKIVSKAEGRVVPEAGVGKAEWVARETRRVVARRADLVIAETRHGFVCANAGVLPLDPDRSARRIRDGIRARGGVDTGVIVSDSFGRAWRRGVTDVAIGCAGIAAIVDLRGTRDAGGRVLEATEVAIADQLAGAAELAMGKAGGVPVAIVRGVDDGWFRESSVRAEIVRPPAEDLFR